MEKIIRTVIPFNSCECGVVTKNSQFILFDNTFKNPTDNPIYLRIAICPCGNIFLREEPDMSFIAKKVDLEFWENQIK